MPLFPHLLLNLGSFLSVLGYPQSCSLLCWSLLHVCIYLIQTAEDVTGHVAGEWGKDMRQMATDRVETALTARSFLIWNWSTTKHKSFIQIKSWTIQTWSINRNNRDNQLKFTFSMFFHARNKNNKFLDRKHIDYLKRNIMWRNRNP